MRAPRPSDAACAAFEFERVTVDSTLKCRNNIFGVKHLTLVPGRMAGS